MSFSEVGLTLCQDGFFDQLSQIVGEKITKILDKFAGGAKECKIDRSRQELSYSNEYLVAKFGFNTAKNESSKVCQKVVGRQTD